jgi:hypothetical protein
VLIDGDAMIAFLAEARRNSSAATVSARESYMASHTASQISRPANAQLQAPVSMPVVIDAPVTIIEKKVEGEDGSGAK